MTVYMRTESPVGDLLLVGEESKTAKGGVALTSVSMTGQKNAPTVQGDWVHAPEALAEVIRQIKAYFAGELTTFDLEHITTGTAFQEQVWQALDTIEYGTTTTYGKLADQIGVPRGHVQALGAAIGMNPLLVVRPCHRVIGADGTMKGYAGGVERKQQLLVHEGALQPMLC
ncbi:methylated-DNA--[protein]-cysteine S-methyltransferase [Sphaerimonospora cavernae]|uniref:Methylated-DNA--[protein]-cysteine S-methyltransferase n=1 Tax=Sphaerimonospora cavernae TaxID=1740611 RepID=A0ABV6U1I2_9ACTN